MAQPKASQKEGAKRTSRKPSGHCGRSATYAGALAALEIAPDAVTLELDGETVKLTRLDKPLWPAAGDLPDYTRRDYVRYLLRVAPYMLAHLRHRPLTLVRQPEGVTGRRFVHFHYEQPLPRFVETVEIYSEKAREAEQYLLCNNAPTLLWLAHVGSLEFHAWHSRATAEPDARGASSDYASALRALERSILNYPDFVVCDLDPYIYSGREAAGAQPEFSRAAFERRIPHARSLARPSRCRSRGASSRTRSRPRTPWRTCRISSKAKVICGASSWLRNRISPVRSRRVSERPVIA